MAYGVWVQAIDDRTGAANVEKYGQYQEFDDLYSEGFAKEFCDGQTAPTGPRWADDDMGMLWVPDEDTARLIQGMLREDITDRVVTEGLRMAATPSWIAGYGQLATSSLTAEILTNTADNVLAAAPAGVNAGQVQTAINAALKAGMRTADEIAEWITKNATWNA